MSIYGGNGLQTNFGFHSFIQEFVSLDRIMTVTGPKHLLSGFLIPVLLQLIKRNNFGHDQIERLKAIAGKKLFGIHMMSFVIEKLQKNIVGNGDNA